MSNKSIKSALSIRTPIKIGTPAVITLPGGDIAQTHPQEIKRICYKDGVLYITIETKNSIYVDVPLLVHPKEHFSDGQIIAKGEFVATSDNSYVTIARILEINEQGIIIEDETGIQLQGQVQVM